MSEYGDLCRKVVDVISERGLANGQFVDADGHVCLTGAVALARGFDPWSAFDTVPRECLTIGRRLVDLGYVDEQGPHPAYGFWPSGFSNDCALMGDPDRLLHALKLVGESFDERAPVFFAVAAPTF